jgi:hypothetical protein
MLHALEQAQVEDEAFLSQMVELDSEKILDLTGDDAAAMVEYLYEVCNLPLYRLGWLNPFVSVATRSIYEPRLRVQVGTCPRQTYSRFWTPSSPHPSVQCHARRRSSRQSPRHNLGRRLRGRLSGPL